MARKLGSFFSGRFFKAADLTTPQLLRIVSVDEEEVGKGRDAETKLVCRFDGQAQGLVLNKTNSESIAEIADSDDLDDWSSFQIVLHAAKTDYGGHQVDCIRVRAPKGGSDADVSNVKLRADRTAAAASSMVADAGISDADVPF